MITMPTTMIMMICGRREGGGAWVRSRCRSRVSSNPTNCPAPLVVELVEALLVVLLVALVEAQLVVLLIALV